MTQNTNAGGDARGGMLEKAKHARAASITLATASAQEKDAALLSIANALERSRKELLDANTRARRALQK